MSVQEILKIVLDLAPKTVEAAEAMLSRTEKDIFIDMITKQAAGGCLTRCLNEGNFEKHDIIVGFVADTDISFDIEYTGAYTRHYEVARGEFIPAFEGQPISLLGMMTYPPTLKNLCGLGYVVFADIDSPYREKIDRYVINDNYQLKHGFLMVRDKPWLPGAADIAGSLMRALGAVGAATNDLAKHRQQMELTAVDAAIGKWG